MEKVTILETNALPLTRCLRALCSGLDQARSSVISWACRSSRLREIFKSRPKRLSLHFGIATVVQLPLAIFFPLPMLILGPMIFGAPHLIASFRHGLSDSPEFLFRRQRSRIIPTLVVWICVATSRFVSPNIQGLWPELAGFALLAIIWLPALRLSGWQGLGAVGTLIVLSSFAFLFPWGAAAFLVLFHHFIAFFHWLRSTKTYAEKRVVFVSLIGFTVIHAVILGGAADEFIGLEPWMGVSQETFTSAFQAWSVDPRFLLRCVVCYAFGQGIHYTLWLKMIPEQQNAAQAPNSFRQSLRSLIGDLGLRGTELTIYFTIAIAGAAYIMSAIDFRWFYLYIASLHGFYEVFGLFLNPRVNA